MIIAKKTSLLAVALYGSFISGHQLTHATHRKSHVRNRQLQNGPVAGILDGLPTIGDENGDGLPDMLDNNMDWSNMDWSNLAPENIDWNTLNWNTDKWNGFIRGLMGGSDGGSMPPIDICPILQSAVGMGQSFGLAGDCSCDGGLSDILTIECSLKECLEASVVCGTVGLNVTVEGATGLIRTSACLDTELDQYKEVCFSYELDMPEVSSNVSDVQPSCAASYGGDPCKCSIDNFCLSIDCSPYLPGAKMDTCQPLAFGQAQDTMSWMPRFAIFNDTFDGTFDFESIEWSNLDWDKLDWNNFGFDQVDWANVDWASTKWGSLFKNGMTDVEVCPILAGRVLGMNESIMGNGCSCGGELDSGFNIACSFEDQCAPLPRGETAIDLKDASASPARMCGDVTLDLAFDSVGSVTGNLCVDFAEDIHPITCINYSIPIADQESLPTCKATYGGDPCECTIDMNLCASIDCSMYESTAVMDTCQTLAIENQEKVPTLVPGFGIPSPPVEEETKDVESNQQAGIPETGLVASTLENSGTASAFSLTLACLAALVSALAF